MSEARLRLRPILFRDACEFVQLHHRHHKPPRGHKFSIAVDDGHEIVGVIMVGRPIARHFDDGLTLEVNRSCTVGTPNANSMLYAAAWRATKALGYDRLITYTQEGESGSSLRAAGWRVVAQRKARAGWSSQARIRSTDTGGVQRVLWEADGV